MIEKEITKMELTLENLVNYIIAEEFSFYIIFLKNKEVYGENSLVTSRARARWSSYYKIAREFGFIDKLKR